MHSNSAVYNFNGHWFGNVTDSGHIVSHEVGHMVIASILNTSPPTGWFDEGFASLCEKHEEHLDYEQRLAHLVSNRSRPNSSWISFKKLVPIQYGSNADYAQLYGMLAFLYDRGGETDRDKADTLISVAGSANPIGVTLTETYGFQDGNDMEAQWLAWYRRGRLGRILFPWCRDGRPQPRTPVVVAPPAPTPQPGRDGTRGASVVGASVELAEPGTDAKVDWLPVDGNDGITDHKLHFTLPRAEDGTSADQTRIITLETRVTELEQANHDLILKIQQLISRVTDLENKEISQAMFLDGVEIVPEHRVRITDLDPNSPNGRFHSELEGTEIERAVNGR